MYLFVCVMPPSSLFDVSTTDRRVEYFFAMDKRVVYLLLFARKMGVPVFIYLFILTGRFEVLCVGFLILKRNPTP